MSFETEEGADLFEVLHQENIIKSYKSNRFEIPESEVLSQVDELDYWFPEDITPWVVLQSYHLLSEPVRRAYNQYYALVVNELFWVFESEFLAPVLQRLILDPYITPSFKRALQCFHDEELKHSRMFNLLNRWANPRLYAHHSYPILLKANRLGIWFLKNFARSIDFFSTWPWIALYMEERSLYLSREYMKDEHSQLSHPFREVHRLHYLEEIYHVNINEILVDQHYRTLPDWKKNLAAKTFWPVLGTLIAPFKTSEAIADLLKIDFPDSRPLIDSCHKEMKAQKGDLQFRERLYGFESTDRLRKICAKHPEMKKVI